jgi:hypothetical protein
MPRVAALSVDHLELEAEQLHQICDNLGGGWARLVPCAVRLRNGTWVDAADMMREARTRELSDVRFTCLYGAKFGELSDFRSRNSTRIRNDRLAGETESM